MMQTDVSRTLMEEVIHHHLRIMGLGRCSHLVILSKPDDSDVARVLNSTSTGGVCVALQPNPSFAMAFDVAMIERKERPPECFTFKAQPKGVITALKAAVGTPQVSTFSTADPLTYYDITAALAKIKSGYLSGASIYADNATIWNVLAGLLDENGRPYFIPDTTAGGVGRMFGLPVKEETAVAGNIVIGNFAKGYVMNINENVTLYQEDNIKARTTTYMSYAIVDGDLMTDKAFALIEKV